MGKLWNPCGFGNGNDYAGRDSAEFDKICRENLSNESRSVE